MNETCLAERGPGLLRLVDPGVLQEDHEAPTGKQGALLQETLVLLEREKVGQDPEHHQRKMKNCCLCPK